MNKMSGVRLACHSFFVRAEHKKNNEQTEALSYICSLFLKTLQPNQSFNA